MHPQLRKLYVPWVVPLQLYSDHLLSIDSQEYVCICVHRCLLFLMSSPLYIVALLVLPFCMGYPEEMLTFARHTNLCIHNSENYMFLWVVLFSCIPTLAYQLLVKSSRTFVITDARYSCGPSSHSVQNDLEKQTPVPHPYLGLGQSSCILTLVHKLLVKSSCAFVLSMPVIHVIRQAILFWND